MRTRDAGFYLKKSAQGIFVSLFLITALFTPRRGEIVGRMLLYETMPNFRIDSDMKEFLGLFPQADAVTVFLAGQFPDSGKNDADINGAEAIDAPANTSADNLEGEVIIALPEAYEQELIGLNDAIYQTDEKSEGTAEYHYSEAPTEADVATMTGLAELQHGFYTVDARTEMTSADFYIDDLMKANLTINRDEAGPKVLVFHTHSTEVYADSVDESEGVLGLGRDLCKLLTEKYGISAMHSPVRHDIVDGASHIMGAYERMEPVVKRILDENPTIELVIDLHRDGVKEDRRLVTEINGKPTAQIMFVNGLSKIYRDGVLMNVDSLPNPNRKANLALSFRAQLAGNKLYPGLLRRIYLKEYRYSLHMSPKSLLVEVGAQTNTKEEAWNALEPLADILAATVLK